MLFINKIFKLLNLKIHVFFFIFFIFTINSIMEVFGIGILASYASFIITQDNIIIQKISSIFQFLDLEMIKINFKSLSICVVIIFLMKFVIKILIELYLEYFTLSKAKDLREKLLEQYIGNKSNNLFLRNTSSYVETILKLTERVQGPCFSSMLKISSDGIVLIFILFFLVSISPTITFVSLILVIAVSFPFIKILHPKLRALGEKQSTASKNIIQNLYELLEGLFEIKIYNKLSFFLKNFKIESQKYFITVFKSNAPFFFVKPFIELIFVLLVVITLLFLDYNNYDLKNNFTIISIFVLSLLRIIPFTSSIVSAANRLSASKYAVDKIYNDLYRTSEIKNFEINKREFKNIKFFELNFDGVCFNYGDNQVVKNFNLNIKKNTITAIFGKSGSGKSTILKLIAGILKPTEGKILLNKKYSIFENLLDWQKKLSYIPQDIFVFEDTVAKNISLEFKYDKHKIQKALKDVDLINDENDLFYDKIISQYGENLSGGQKQRLAIARSLYFERDILLLDEITNQLDSENENRIFSLLQKYKKNKTIIFISHNQKLLSVADQVIEIK